MTTSFLIPDLKRDEGCRLQAYPDPVSHAEPYTVGYGCTGPDIGPSTVWTQEQADAALAQRVAEITPQLAKLLPWWGELSGIRQDVFVNMAYNLGVHGLLTFHTALTYAEEGKYQFAGQAILNSRWAAQVGNRALRLSRQLASGVHQSLPA